MNNKEIIDFWKDRVLPDTCQHLKDLSNPSKDEIDELEELRYILFEAEKRGVELSWGHQMKKKSVAFSWKWEVKFGD